MNHTNWKKWLLLPIPLVLGVTGFLIEGTQPTDAVFFSLGLYTMSNMNPAPNLLVDLARWTAPIATASGVLLLFSSVRRRLKNAWRYRRGQSVAVYGPEQERKHALAALGNRGIDGGELTAPGYRVSRYLLLGGEEENFAFYRQNQERLRGREIYLRCGSVLPQQMSNPELRLFSPEETAARLYWKEHCLYAASAERGHKLSVVLLGFQALGQHLLLYALQDNLFSPDQKITYHIFGDAEACGRFRAVRPGLDEIPEDRVIFHSEPWYQSLPVLEEAAAVLITEAADRAALLGELLQALHHRRITLFAPETSAAGFLARSEGLVLFPLERAKDPDLILGDALYRRAKRINLRYAHLYSGVAETEEAAETEWRKLDGFTRYSNISSADYHEVQLKMLEEMGEPADPAGMSPEVFERLSELEHLRWCRYHWLNGWRYGVPENGKAKDPAKRIHVDLVLYNTLTEAEKDKDRENLRVLFSVE